MKSSLYFCLLFVVSWAAASKDIQVLMDNLISKLDKRIRPGYPAPLDVKLQLKLMDVYGFDEINHQVTYIMFTRHIWKDERLAFDPNEVNGTETFLLDNERVNKYLWIPDTFIANQRSGSAHSFAGPSEFTRVHFNGTIIRSVQMTSTVSCYLYLRWFPFDQNVCALDFESYGYTKKDVVLKWGRGEDGQPKIHMNKQATQSVRHTITAFRAHDSEEALYSGPFTKASLKIYFKRLSFRYLLDVYFPATAIPVVSFITLCVGPMHFRVLMSTICMAIMVIYAAILMLLTPKVDYKTALDFYVFNSSVTVFNVVLVNFLMYHLLKPKANVSQIRMHNMNGSRDEGKGILVEEDGVDDATPGPASSSPPRFPNKTYEILYKLCEKSYLTMPLFFVVFNLIYWPVVLIGSSGTPEDFLLVDNMGWK
ncbi:Gamma-aminobutyric acid receptor subunit beta [Orchesella cincta]|uniref:Gamma-aminobutyric acid receptor subunit beta n=1 Tax=Orchesella cincta TaxID=48709 RepID=A0A1D2MV92_ORCCI|nr:Gamma-aminobutyric acid receptor subunit beta [Orchesella cincta]